MSKKATATTEAKPKKTAVYWNLPPDLHEYINHLASTLFPGVGGKQNQIGVLLLREARKARERKERLSVQ